MRFLARIVLATIMNSATILLAAYLIPGFQLIVAIKEIALLALIFTLLSMIVKPIIKLILSPLIILTLGVGLIVVNMIVLKILDFLSRNLTIVDIRSLFYAALLVGLANIIFHLATRK